MTGIAPPLEPAFRPAPLGRTAGAHLRRLRWVVLPLVAIASIASYRRWVPVAVLAHRIDRGAVHVEAFGRGTLESERQADLGFDLVGRVAEVLVDEGDRVKRGQELARLSPEQAAADLRTAVSSVGAARTTLGRLAAEEQRAQVALEAADREAARTRDLAQTGVSSRRELDEAEDALRLARADHDRILAQQAEALRGIDVATGGASQRQATMQRSTLLAPFDGVIARRVRDPGNTVNVGSTVLRIVDTDRVYVRAWIDETMASRIAEGQEAECSFPGSDRPTTATVIRIGAETDRQTHELLVDLRPTGLPPRLTVGQRVDVWIRTRSRANAVRVPPAFVRHDGSADSCAVDTAGKTSIVPVRLGAIGRDYIEVLEGLREGDRVLRSPEPAGTVMPGRRWRGVL